MADQLGGEPTLVATIPLGFDAAARQDLADRLTGAGTAPGRSDGSSPR